jgi:hypothetical protein
MFPIVKHCQLYFLIEAGAIIKYLNNRFYLKYVCTTIAFNKNCFVIHNPSSLIIDSYRERIL